jgi:Fe2+ transport system protein FeoA
MMTVHRRAALIASDSQEQSNVSTDSANAPVRLPQLRTGHCGTVTVVDADSEEVHRLMAMGVCTGRKVMLIRRGDPLILKVLGSRIGLSARLADRVEVVPCDDPCPKGDPS